MARSKKESSPAPKPAAKKVVAVADKKKEPGLLKQVAANAAGVAVGSAVGHAIGHKLVNGGGEKKTEESAFVPCDLEWQQFVRCSKEKNEQHGCLTFMESFKECQKKNNL